MAGRHFEERRKHLLSIALFLLGVVLIDRGLGWVLQSASTRIVDGDTLKHVNVAPAYIGDGIVVFGSSRARHHVDPQVLSDRTGLSAYNAGANGQGILFHRAMQELLLQQAAHPKFILLQVDPSEICEGSFRAPRVVALAPYIDRSANVRDVILQGDSRALIKQVSTAWRYNSQIHQFFSLLTNAPPEGNKFAGLNGAMNQQEVAELIQNISKAPANQSSPAELAAIMEMYREFIRRARDNQIEVVLFMGPCFVRQKDVEANALAALRQLAAEFTVPFLELDEEKYDVFRDSAVYRDGSHLNAQGAAVLTELLSDHIRSLSLVGELPTQKIIQANHLEESRR